MDKDLTRQLIHDYYDQHELTQEEKELVSEIYEELRNPEFDVDKTKVMYDELFSRISDTLGTNKNSMNKFVFVHSFNNLILNQMLDDLKFMCNNLK